jgi:putative copper export protein
MEGRVDWVTFGVQWLHVLLGIVWFGYSLALAIFFIPAISRLPITTQRQIGAALGSHAAPIIDVVAPSIVVLGFIRGTLLGPIDSVTDVFTTAYGLTWLVALIAAVATYLWGKLVILGAVERLNTAPLTAEGGPTPELDAAVGRAKQVTVLELMGFLVIFTCMILMRFGQ